VLKLKCVVALPAAGCNGCGVSFIHTVTDAPHSRICQAMSHPSNAADAAAPSAAPSSSVDSPPVSVSSITCATDQSSLSQRASSTPADGDAEALALDERRFYRVGLPPTAVDDAVLLLPGGLAAANFVRQWLPDKSSCAHKLAFQLIVPKSLTCVFAVSISRMFQAICIRTRPHDALYT
jgi:hypothetical protein